jgi:hypothetical protein
MQDAKVNSEIPARLLLGAEKLGEFWRAGDRCPLGWQAVECECKPETRFCRAKKLWISLALQIGRMIEEGDYGLVLMMRASEWDKTGLVLKMEIPDVGVIGVGKKGAIAMSELGKITPETLPSILKVFKFFPGAQVAGEVFVSPPASAPPPQKTA